MHAILFILIIAIIYIIIKLIEFGIIVIPIILNAIALFFLLKILWWVWKNV
jgi:hypothetical protein